MGMALRVLTKAAPVSASCADDMVVSRILQMTRMVPFS